MTSRSANDPDLFADVREQEEPEVLSVSGLTKQVRDVLESRFTSVTVEGEVSNYLHHRSGHRYWTLKDEDAQISCTLWKSRPVNFQIESGQRVVCRGRVTVYPPRGSYQLDVFQIRPLGVGALQQAYERLFKKLEAEGLFDPSRKRPIPRFPKRIGIVTSATGAAIHDILTVLRRRFPLTEVLVRPAAVQGVGSELQVAQGIKDLNALPQQDRPEVMIVGRGGGSIEDLWTFNEEAVARAIFSSAIPVVSAVGHEVDVTISDFVADLRAPTPTAAAELITPNIVELSASVIAAAESIQRTTEREIARLREALISHSSGYGLRHVLTRAFEMRGEQLRRYAELIRSRVDRHIERTSLTLKTFDSTLRALDPKAVLSRGYAIVRDESGHVLRSPDELPEGANARIEWRSGQITVKRTG